MGSGRLVDLLDRRKRRLHWKPPALTRRGPSTWRFTASFAGDEFFVEADVPLSANLESLVCAFFLHAMASGRGVALRDPVDGIFLENLARARAISRAWWGHPGGRIEGPTARGAPPVGRAGMYFTGGVDSFFTLAQKQEELSLLVYVEGFDARPKDLPRLEKIGRSLRAVADACGLESHTARTDLRRHRLFRSLNWEITHGAALAAIAHALRENWSTAIIAGANLPPPWGSRPELDPAWSSASLEIVNSGHELRRLDKVGAICTWPLVHQHLRVCWENRSDDLNCGACEKCVRTQLEFSVHGQLHALETFPEGSLPERIDALPPLPAHLAERWGTMLPRIPDAALRSAAQRLVARSDVAGGARPGE